MMRWIWAALCVTSTLWLASQDVSPWLIAASAVLDLDAIARAMRGGR
jgi:hypothetical protein